MNQNRGIKELHIILGTQLLTTITVIDIRQLYFNQFLLVFGRDKQFKPQLIWLIKKFHGMYKVKQELPILYKIRMINLEL
jgi:hypothetical protein